MEREITKNIYSVGVVDHDIRIFHGYEVPKGTSYNSYLIVNDKIALIDFVKEPFKEEFLQNIKNIIGDKAIDYFICNHVEPDHSGALPFLLEEYPTAKIFGTEKCKAGLTAYYPNSDLTNFVSVTKDDTLSIGDKTLHFIPAPMVHWPDSMLTYLADEKILFSNDALGEHMAIDNIWDEAFEKEFFLERIADYYANIILPFGFSVTNLLKTLSSFDIEMVCPSHGAILKNYLGDVLPLYQKWANQEVDENKVVIAYDSMWGTTEKMAKTLEKEWSENGYDVEIFSLSKHHYSYVMGKLLEAKYIFVGSPTLNNEMLPTVIAFLTYMKGLKPKNRIGKAFGSYGWSGESVTKINNILQESGFETLDEEKTVWNI